MDVYKIFLASLLGFALLNYFVIPSAKKKWNANKSLAKVSKAGVLGVLNFARTFLLIAALTYLVLSVFIFLQGLSVGVTTAELKAASEKIQKYRDIISSTQKYLVGLIALMIIAILAVLSYRRERRHLQEDFAEKIAREKERLQREAEEGRWEPLPQTQEMRAVLERIQAAQQTYDLIDSGQVLVNGDINAHKETLRKAIRELRDAWHALDFERRMQISFDSDPSISNESHGSGKFSDFISSKGLLASMKTASRSLSHAGTALLVLALVGVSGTSVSNNLEAQQVRWNDLIVAANQKEVKEKFDRLLAQNPTETVKKEDDDKTKKENKAVYNYLARNFERSLAQSTVWRSAQQFEHSNTTSRRNAVKSEILSETRTSTSDAYKKYWDDGPDTPTSDSPGPKPPKPGPKTGPGSNHPSSKRTPSAQSADDGVSGRTVVEVPEPETLIGKQVAKDLEATLEKRPNLLARIKAKIVSQIGQFSEPAEITDAADYAFSEIFGTFVDSSVGTADSEVNNLLSKIGKSAIKSSGKEAYQVLYQRMMNDLAGETSVADTYGHIRTFASADFPIVKTATLTPLSDASLSLTSSEEYAKYIEQHPPALADNPLDAKELEAAAEKFKTAYDPKKPTVELNLFASYDDIYKAQSTARTQTLKERLVAELRNEAPRAEGITSTSADFSRSRSFAELVGHSETGGVLIGRAPDDISQAGDFIDLRWTIDNSLLKLILTRSDGKEFLLGPYKTSLVHQGLAYAADGRKSSVTILNVDRNGHQKVFLHPAFVDSELGQEIIDLDKFIFDVMEKQPTYIAAQQRIEAQRMLYEMAYADRFAAFDADQLRQINLAIQQQGLQLDPDQSKQRNDIEGRLRKVQSWLADIKVNQLAAEALKAPGDLTDPKRSILARKPEFFDAKIVEKIGTCAANAGSSRDFNQCMQSSFDYEVSAATDATLKEWAIPPPKIESLSGVRETPFTVTSDLNCLRIENANGPIQLWPLDYTILRAFSSTPAFLTNGKDPAKYVDLNPWEFDDLKPEITDRVWNKINADANLRLMYQDLRDFTVLQRLFRVALETDAWKQFPIEKLADLTRATADSHKHVPTQRWENPLHGSLKPDLLASD